MKTISNLDELLKNMQPKLAKEKYHLASADISQLLALADCVDYIFCICRESEGLSVVFSEEIKSVIERLTNEKVEGPYALITLNVYSDLNAVGFLAEMTNALADKKIPVNVVSAFHHDHLLVPWDKKNKAMEILHFLAKTRTCERRIVHNSHFLAKTR